ncbi:MAG: beta-lactamase family protein [Myxococcales bacterium FL481]|nr:MAG: beta-lactamase family protein [Myxococcales bacterium FL481]
MANRREVTEREALDSWSAIDPPASFADDVMARLEREGDSPQPALRAEPVPAESPPRRSWDRWWGRVAAAAGVALAMGAGAWIASREPTTSGPVAARPVPPATRALDSSPTPALEQAALATEPLPPDLEPRVLDYVGQYGRNYGDAFRYHGIVAVARGDASHVWGFGETALGSATVPTDQSQFRLGTLTQQFVAVATLRFVERGRIALDDTLYTVLPSYPVVETARKITVRDLLAHTSGLPNIHGVEAYWRGRYAPHAREELLKYFAHAPLEFVPGTDFAASNSNYIVLGLLLERLGGCSLEQVLTEEVFEPAGMRETRLSGMSPGPHHTTGYEFSELEKLVEARPVHPSAIRGAGAATSTAHDMLAWHRALIDDSLLSDEMRRLMHRPVRREFGLGWVVDEVVGRRAYGHPGGTPGYNASVLRFADGTFVLAMANTQAVDCRAVTEGVASLVYGEEPPQVLEQIEIAMARSTRRDYVGEYRLSAASRHRYRHLPPDELAAMQWVAIEDDGRLWFVVAGHGRKWMHPEARDQFFFKDYPRSVASFERDDTGHVARIRVSDRVREFVLDRVD